jgi:hypothetical protein
VYKSRERGRAADGVLAASISEHETGNGARSSDSRPYRVCSRTDREREREREREGGRERMCECIPVVGKIEIKN